MHIIHIPEEDILLVDKPSGMTSFDVIRVLRKKLGIRKMGHAGTLDPLATGLMIIGVEGGTKKLDAYLKLPKIYDAEILLGERRSTGDMEGQIVESKIVEPISDEILRATLKTMEGTLTLPVSAYSAIKQGGVPLYKRARKAEKKGESITTLPLRAMEVERAEMTGVMWGEGKGIVSVRFSVGSGTYIRSLAEEFGRRLGYPATIHRLRRIAIGPYSIADARKLENF